MLAIIIINNYEHMHTSNACCKHTLLQRELQSDGFLTGSVSAHPFIDTIDL